MCLAARVSEQIMQRFSMNIQCKACKDFCSETLNKSSNDSEYLPQKVCHMNDVPSKVSLLRSTSPLREMLPWHKGQMLHSPWQLAVSTSTQAL